MDNFNIEVGLQYIDSFKRIAYQPWFALAEFIDNSTQSYFNNERILKEEFKKTGESLTVSINYSKKDNTLTIKDNSIGMSVDELKSALMIGLPKENAGRSKYGIGMKTAACWFGNLWTVETSKLGENIGSKITINVPQIVASNNGNLENEPFHCSSETHYTTITIRDLNRKLHGNTLIKIKDFLSSIYRIDFSKHGLILNWQDEKLNWEGFDGKFYITQENKPYKIPFEFSIGSSAKRVAGWVGVLAIGNGGREKAGFSVIQNNRVIQGCPKAYRPSTVFGTQENGTNDLINQRVVGELFVDGFAVSHTKDQIDWEDYEEELEEELGKICADAKALARNIRAGKGNNSNEDFERVRSEALALFESELKSDEFRDKLFLEQIPNERVLEISFKRMVETTVSSEEPALIVSVGDEDDSVSVRVYFRKSSEFEPYVVIETTQIENEIIIILNALHPYWLEIKMIEGFLTYIRNSVYDGLSEWKARRKTSRLNPETIRHIKDSFMRLPYEILNNKFFPPDDE